MNFKNKVQTRFDSGAGSTRNTSRDQGRGSRRIEKKPIDAKRVRHITGSFAFIEHRFLRDGFWQSLDHHQLLLYMFLVLVGDRKGLSYYSYDKICGLLAISLDEYIAARDALIDYDLIAFDGNLFQVLALPVKPIARVRPALKNDTQMQRHDPATIRQIIMDSPLAKHHE